MRNLAALGPDLNERKTIAASTLIRTVHEGRMQSDGMGLEGALLAAWNLHLNHGQF